jgi:hypothetical protein
MALSRFRERNRLLLVFASDEGSERRRHLPVEEPVYSPA